METWFWIVLGVAIALIVTFLACRWLLQRFARPPKKLVARLGKLTWRQRLQLGLGLLGDPRLPLLVRLLIPAVGLYLILPLDIIPDFIPVIGALDDVLLVLLVLRLLLRAIPQDVLDDHFERLERPEAHPRIDEHVTEAYATTRESSASGGSPVSR